MPLVPCLSCGRHVRADESACPFCAASRAGLAIALGLATAALTACVPEMTAVYGPAPAPSARVSPAPSSPAPTASPGTGPTAPPAP